MGGFTGNFKYVFELWRPTQSQSTIASITNTFAKVKDIRVFFWETSGDEREVLSKEGTLTTHVFMISASETILSRDEFRRTVSGVTEVYRVGSPKKVPGLRGIHHIEAPAYLVSPV